MITDALLAVSDNPIIILLLINVLLLVLGAPLDMAPLILIMTPILYPVVMELGLDPVHFGIILILNLGIGLITPPVGNVLFVGCAIGKGVYVTRLQKHSSHFFLVMVAVLMLITYVRPYRCGFLT